MKSPAVAGAGRHLNERTRAAWVDKTSSAQGNGNVVLREPRLSGMAERRLPCSLELILIPLAAPRAFFPSRSDNAFEDCGFGFCPRHIPSKGGARQALRSSLTAGTRPRDENVGQLAGADWVRLPTIILESGARRRIA